MSSWRGMHKRVLTRLWTGRAGTRWLAQALSALPRLVREQTQQTAAWAIPPLGHRFLRFRPALSKHFRLHPPPPSVTDF